MSTTEAASNALKGFGTRKVKWAIFKIPDGSDCGCDVQDSSDNLNGDCAAEWAAMKEKAPTDEPRWIIYDLQFEKNGVNNSKVVFMQYVPDDCTKMATKFAYAQGKEDVKGQLQVNKELQVNDHADLDRDKIIANDF